MMGELRVYSGDPVKRAILKLKAKSVKKFFI